jgi:hypothetical protein
MNDQPLIYEKHDNGVAVISTNVSSASTGW